MMESPFTLPEGNVQISFSGGRTSGFMLHSIAETNGGIPDRCKVVFANTGREMPETMDFVNECSVRWNIPIVWVEFIPDQPKFQVVSHNSAARDGEPFEALIRLRKFLPNQQARFCTGDLKVKPSAKYLRSIGWEHWMSALGIRADEPGRVNREPQRERWQRWYPLADAGIAKAHVTAFWAKQPFDLRLQNVRGNTALGNCDGCFLKSEKTLSMLARDFPDRHAWWERMEDIVSEHARGKAGRFRKEYYRRELRDFVERQGDWIFDAPGVLCQKDGGECVV